MSSTPLAKYRYRRRLPHLQRADADLFVTFCTARFSLPDVARDLVLEHCLREGGVARAPSPANNPLPRIHLHAAVVMPDHVHLLLQPLRNGDAWPFPLVAILQCLKSATAHQINKLLHHEGPVWEEESFDHVLRSDESLKEKAEYIRQNPVRRGLVPRPEDCCWLWVRPRRPAPSTLHPLTNSALPAAFSREIQALPAFAGEGARATSHHKKEKATFISE